MEGALLSQRVKDHLEIWTASVPQVVEALTIELLYVNLLKYPWKIIRITTPQASPRPTTMITCSTDVAG